MLLGLLVDVSSSMATSIQSRSGSARTRLDSLRRSFEDLVESAARLCVEGVGGEVSPRLRVFAYGFGFGNPLGFLLGDSGPKVRDILALQPAADSAVTIDELARNWRTYQDHIGTLVKKMFGDTPMGEAFRIARDRIDRELAAREHTKPPIIFVVSDGVPTDLPPAAVRRVADELKSADVVIVSCLLTDEDLTEPRRLYGTAQQRWPEAAELMFDCASPLPPSSPFDAYLIENRWNVEPGARLFAQINQSEVLDEFSKLVLSPLRTSGEETPRRFLGDPIRVFVTYSHQDAAYLNDDSLMGFLSPLENEGVEFFTDRQISTGALWDAEIHAAIETTDVVLALVSQAFLASEYCRDVEMKRFLEARRRSGTKILPVILRSCDWRSVDWLSQTQSRPREGRTIELDYDTKGKRDQVFLEILQDVRAAVHAVRDERRRR